MKGSLLSGVHARKSEEKDRGASLNQGYDIETKEDEKTIDAMCGDVQPCHRSILAERQGCAYRRQSDKGLAL